MHIYRYTSTERSCLSSVSAMCVSHPTSSCKLFQQQRVCGRSCAKLYSCLICLLDTVFYVGINSKLELIPFPLAAPNGTAGITDQIAMEVVEMSTYDNEFAVIFSHEDVSMASFSWTTVQTGRYRNAQRMGKLLLTNSEEERARRIVRLAHRRPLFLASSMFFMNQEYHKRRKLLIKWQRVIDRHYTAICNLEAGVAENQKVMVAVRKAAMLADKIRKLDIMKVKKLEHRKFRMARLLVDSQKAITRLRWRQKEDEKASTESKC